MIIVEMASQVLKTPKGDIKLNGMIKTNISVTPTELFFLNSILVTIIISPLQG